MRFPTTLLAATLVAALPLSPGSVLAGPQLTGFFIATETCPAFRSKNEGTNPGNAETRPGQAYQALELNMAGGDWYRIRIPGALDMEERWVSANCGTHVIDAGTGPDDDGDDTGDGAVPTPPGGGAESTDNVLALSWQPAFCEAKAGKPECKALNRGDLPHAAQGFSLHGLWPQKGDPGRPPFYCDASDTSSVRALDKPDTWDQLPAITLSAALAAKLAVAMPGTASSLELHEWHKHGSCYRDAAGAEGYFSDTLRLMDELNASAVGTLVAQSVGEEVAVREIADAFEQAFGIGASRKVKFDCAGDGGRALLVEIVISLEGTIDEAASLAALIAAAPDADRGDCDAEVTIDPAGLQ